MPPAAKGELRSRPSGACWVWLKVVPVAHPEADSPGWNRSSALTAGSGPNLPQLGVAIVAIEDHVGLEAAGLDRGRCVLNIHIFDARPWKSLSRVKIQMGYS